MNVEITNSSFAPIAKISLEKGESIRLQPGAMVYEKGNIELEGQLNANGKKGLSGALSALGRSVSSDESFYISQAKSLSDLSTLAVAPESPGKIIALDVAKQQWRLNTGAFLASDNSVTYEMKRQKLSGALFGGTGGLYMMETTGKGTLLISAFGDLEKISLDGSEPVIIDNQHVVAWSHTLDYDIKVASGLFGFKTGEGIINEFHGTGDIYIQTRNISSFSEQIHSFISE